MTPAPIALFVYNRLSHTRETVDALRKNILASESDLFVFSDGPKNEEGRAKVEELRVYLKTITGFKSTTVVEREKNMGLAQSIITGVTDIVGCFGTVIVVEDDLVTSPYFLSYMNQGLELYKDEPKVASIHGYMYPTKAELPQTFFIKGADCWGWATWKRAWDVFESNGTKLLNEIESKNLGHEFNFDNMFMYTEMLKGQIEGRNNSWAVRWYASAFLKNMLTLYPGKSLVQNIGFDGSGTHSKAGGGVIFGKSISTESIDLKKVPVEESVVGRKAFVQYFKSTRPKPYTRLRRIPSRLKAQLKKIKIIRKLVIKSRIVFDFLFAPKGGPLHDRKPWIAQAATAWLENYLTKDMHVFEWGSGGSTLFSALRTKKVISIEHNYPWFLKTQFYLKRAHIENCDYRFIEAEKTNSPSSYTSTDKKYAGFSFEKYVRAIESFPDNHFDLIFIDGRARSSCVLLAKEKVKRGGYILLDNAERMEYQEAITTLRGFERTDFTENGSTTSIFKKI